MARDAITIQDADNDGVVASATAIVAADDLVIEAGGWTDRLLVMIDNTGGSAGTITVKAGSYDDGAFREGLGDLNITAGTNLIAFTVEGARHAQADGDIHIDVTAGLDGQDAYAFRLSKE